MLVNAWDVGSAKLIAQVPGCRAVATSSAAVAWALGYADGEQIPREEMLEVVRRVAAAVELPVTADLEAGYGDASATAAAAWQAGAVGMNLEDGEASLEEHVERVRAARAAAPELVINARTDLYLLGRPDFEETVARANAYLEAGADCAFVPGVYDAETIGKLAVAIKGPLNVLASPTLPAIADLQKLGVARVSVGSGIAKAALAFSVRATEEVFERGTFECLEGAIPHAEMQELLG